MVMVEQVLVAVQDSKEASKATRRWAAVKQGRRKLEREQGEQTHHGKKAQMHLWLSQNPSSFLRPRTTDDFQSICVLGQGGRGTVHLVKEKASQEYFALKQVKKELFRPERAFAERAILGFTTSRWLVKLMYTFQDQDSAFAVMELVQGGDLYSHIRDERYLTVEATRFYMAELLEALAAVHRCGFAHRDIKPDNIMIASDGHLKLVDFDSCKRLPAASGGMMGTPAYMAPEAYRGVATTAVDVWSWGIVLFECICGDLPFNAPLSVKDKEEEMKITRRQVMQHSSLLPSRIQAAKEKDLMPPMVEELLFKVICEQEHRLTVDQIRNDPFFEGLNFEELHLLPPPFVPKLSGPEDVSLFEHFDPIELPPAKFGFQSSSPEWANYEFDRKALKMQEMLVGQQLGGVEVALMAQALSYWNMWQTAATVGAQHCLTAVTTAEQRSAEAPVLGSRLSPTLAGSAAPGMPTISCAGLVNSVLQSSPYPWLYDYHHEGSHAWGLW